MNQAPEKSFVPPRVLGILAIVFAALSVARAQNPSDSPGASPANTARTVAAVIPKNVQTKQDKDKLVGGGQTANETKAATTDHNSKTALARIKQGDELGVEIGDLKKRIESEPNIVATAKLFLDCKPVAGLQPRACVSQNKIIFLLDRAAIRQITPRTRTVSVGVGFNNAREPEVIMPEKIELVLVAYDWRLAAAVGLVVVIAILLWRYGRYTNLLRDEPPPPSGPTAPSIPVWRLFTALRPLRATTDLGPFSLAKVQMAWWLFFVVSAFLLIWLAVGDFNSMTTSALVLLGISAGTAAGSKLVDSSKQKTAQNLQATTTVLNRQIAEAGGAARPAVQAEAIKVAQAQVQLQDLQRPAEEIKSEGFLTDIMSDDTGVSVHRFQMVVWTAVLTVIFVSKVCQDFAMPEFSSTLLTLMGISSGAYLTLKVPEKHSVPVP
jgi:hypothetical protein